MQQTKRQYETTFIVNAGLDDAQIDTVIEKVKDFIVKQGGEIIEVNKWGRKRLTFSIQKKNNGFYTCIEFKAPGDTIAKLERYYFLEENILRYLTIVLDKKAIAGKAQQAAKQALAEAEQAASAPVAPVQAEVPMTDADNEDDVK